MPVPDQTIRVRGEYSPRSDRERPSAAHIPELDGIRGVAILLVLATHWQEAWHASSSVDRAVQRLAATGWLGVELFFALSGFLITRLLLQQRHGSEHVGAYLGHFMWRRALRIFPLYYAALTVLFFVVPRIVTIRDPAFHVLQANAAWYWLYGVNWLQAIHGPAAVPFNTGHFWSLAVEEQFYLVWPLVVWCVAPKRLPLLCIGLWTASLVARLTVGESFDPVRATTVLHLDPLMAGALVAWYATYAARRPVERYIPYLAGAGIIVTVAWVMIAGGRSMLWLAAASFALLIAGIVLEPGHSGRSNILRSRVLRMFGTYSYCLYVVHYVLLVPLDRLMPRMPVPPLWGSSLPYALIYGIVLVGTSLGVAALSWRFFERPILRLKDAYPRLPRHADNNARARSRADLPPA